MTARVRQHGQTLEASRPQADANAGANIGIFCTIFRKTLPSVPKNTEAYPEKAAGRRRKTLDDSLSPSPSNCHTSRNLLFLLSFYRTFHKTKHKSPLHSISEQQNGNLLRHFPAFFRTCPSIGPKQATLRKSDWHFVKM